MSSYTIPNVIAQHPRGERIMDVYSHLLTERIVYLGTAIDPGVANTLIAQLLHLEAESAEQEISLYINCEGGDLPSMLAVYDTMQYIQAPVATTCVGQAIGVGAVLLCAASGTGRVWCVRRLRRSACVLGRARAPWGAPGHALGPFGITPGR